MKKKSYLLLIAFFVIVFTGSGLTLYASKLGPKAKLITSKSELQDDNFNNETLEKYLNSNTYSYVDDDSSTVIHLSYKTGSDVVVKEYLLANGDKLDVSLPKDSEIFLSLNTKNDADLIGNTFWNLVKDGSSIGVKEGLGIQKIDRGSALEFSRDRQVFRMESIETGKTTFTFDFSKGSDTNLNFSLTFNITE